MQTDALSSDRSVSLDDRETAVQEEITDVSRSSCHLLLVLSPHRTKGVISIDSRGADEPRVFLASP